MIDIDRLKEALIGGTKENAIQTLEGISSQAVVYRIIEHGEFAVTMDYDEQRVNVRLDVNGIVDQVWLG